MEIRERWLGRAREVALPYPSALPLMERACHLATGCSGWWDAEWPVAPARLIDDDGVLRVVVEDPHTGDVTQVAVIDPQFEATDVSGALSGFINGDCIQADVRLIQPRIVDSVYESYYRSITRR